MTTAFIFTSAADQPLAALCKDRLLSLGWDAFTVGDKSSGCDIRAGFQRGDRLSGSDCAIGMATYMHHVVGVTGVVAKIDSDTLVTDEGAAWLSGATEKARCLHLVPGRWCGIWSAPAAVFPAVIQLLRKSSCSHCPESRLFELAFEKTCGTEHDGPGGKVWIPGRAWGAGMLTLPSNVRGNRRVEAGTAMFGAGTLSGGGLG